MAHEPNSAAHGPGLDIDPASGQALNLTLVEAGQAAVYRRYCADPRYLRAEASAAGLGIWSTPGDHQRPWEWRRR